VSGSGAVPNPAATAAAPRTLVAAAALAVGLATLAAAWTGDDAMVTFRTVENLVAGDGMRWNIAERTQTATHPLWVLVLAAARWLTGEPFYTAIALGVLCTTAAAWVLARGRGHRTLLLATAAMLTSHAFVDYGTCGLENPLVYLLLSLFAAVWFDEEPGARRLFRLGSLGSLLVLARQDLVLLLLPCVLAALRGVRPVAAARALLPGTALVCAWYAFALLYYGTVVPTPGHGKVLAVGVPAGDLFVQGCRYILDLALRDPATALVLGAALVLGPLHRRPLLWLPALGIGLQVAYTLRVGGDFMAGRFFTPAFVFALAVVLRSASTQVATAGTALLALTPLLAGPPSWLNPAPLPAEARLRHGIVDERSYYAEVFGLWSSKRGWPMPAQVSGQLRAQGRNRPLVDLAATVGHRGLLAGPLVHMVEPWICDPLLVRLPVADPAHWRIGHFTRRIPEGYLETLASGENHIHHPALARYWEVLRLVLRAPVFDGIRLSAWWQFVRGDYEPLLEQYVAEEYRNPPRIEVDASQLAVPVPVSTHWFDARSIVVREGGLRVRLGGMSAAAQVLLQVDGGGRGRMLLERGGTTVATVPFEVPALLLAGARPLVLAVPPGTSEFDALELQLERTGDPATAVLELFAVLSVRLQ
jgi:arabinofuranosyltransferase